MHIFILSLGAFVIFYQHHLTRCALLKRRHFEIFDIFAFVGPVELDVKVVQSEARFRVVVVDLGSVYKTQGGDPVYWLEKAEVIERNKWEMMIEMEFGSDLKGTVKSEPFRVTTKASYKIKGKGGWYFFIINECKEDERRTDSCLMK